MDHLELCQLKGGTGSMVDFTNGYPRKALDLGCGVRFLGALYGLLAAHSVLTDGM